MQQSPASRRTRAAIFAAVAVASVVPFLLLGGTSLAHGAISLIQYQYGKKIVICHKHKNTITISVRAWAAHKRHGDSEGRCAPIRHPKRLKTHLAGHKKGHGKTAERSDRSRGGHHGGNANAPANTNPSQKPTKPVDRGHQGNKAGEDNTTGAAAQGHGHAKEGAGNGGARGNH